MEHFHHNILNIIRLWFMNFSFVTRIISEDNLHQAECCKYFKTLFGQRFYALNVRNLFTLLTVLETLDHCLFSVASQMKIKMGSFSNYSMVLNLSHQKLLLPCP